MVEIEERLKKLKDFWIYFLDDIHDLLVSITDESIEFYEAMWYAFEEHKKKITTILTSEEYTTDPLREFH